MTPLAAVILAHADPSHLRRLVEALEDIPVFLHCDASTRSREFQRMVEGLPPSVFVCRRLRTTLASWSLVEAELEGLRGALATTSAGHIAVLSGSDYPLASVERIASELQAWAGASWFWNTPLPLDGWSTPRNPDGGMWRFRRRFIVRDDQVVFWRNIPLRWPLRREIPPELALRAGSQWKIYCREHAKLLLQLVDRRRDLVKFWRTTLVPDESFAATMLASPALAGGAALPPCRFSAWFIDWRGETSVHPRWLSEPDFDRLRAVRRAAPAEAVDATLAGPALPHDAVSYRRLFARKFSSRDAAVLSRIDAELRV